MASEVGGIGRAVVGLAAVTAALLAEPAAAAGSAGGTISYQCTLNGSRITRDRLIPECKCVDQRVLNADGSLREIIPPTLTAEERGDLEAEELLWQAGHSEYMKDVQRDRLFMQKYPNDPSHRKARERALEDFRTSVRNLQARMELLMKERKPLLDESEFYVGKPLPPKLKQALDNNDASIAATRALIANQNAEVKRINDSYDNELLNLKKLWAGAPAGSLGLNAKWAVRPPARRRGC